MISGGFPGRGVHLVTAGPGLSIWTLESLGTGRTWGTLWTLTDDNVHRDILLLFRFDGAFKIFEGRHFLGELGDLTLNCVGDHAGATGTRTKEDIVSNLRQHLPGLGRKLRRSRAVAVAVLRASIRRTLPTPAVPQPLAEGALIVIQQNLVVSHIMRNLVVDTRDIGRSLAENGAGDERTWREYRVLTPHCDTQKCSAENQRHSQKLPAWAWPAKPARNIKVLRAIGASRGAPDRCKTLPNCVANQYATGRLTSP